MTVPGLIRLAGMYIAAIATAKISAATPQIVTASFGWSPNNNVAIALDNAAEAKRPSAFAGFPS